MNRHGRVLGVLFFLPGPVLLSIALAVDGAPVGAWIVLFAVLAVGYGVLAGLVAGSRRSGTRAVTATRAAMPDALLVCRAIDERVRPRGVRLFVIDRIGIMLANGRGTRIKPVWRLPWEQIGSASPTQARFRSGSKPALRIQASNGETKALGLVTGYGFTHSIELTESAAELINRHARQGAAS